MKVMERLSGEPLRRLSPVCEFEEGVPVFLPAGTFFTTESNGMAVMNEVNW